MVVKFTRTYSIDAHRDMAEIGFAPQILGFKKLPGDWTMIIMELLEAAVTWHESSWHSDEKLLEAIRKLHDMGWVHGDIRGTNVPRFVRL